MPGIAGGYYFGTQSFPVELVKAFGDSLRAAEAHPVYSVCEGRLGVALSTLEAAKRDSRWSVHGPTGALLILDGEVVARGSGTQPVPAEELLRDYIRDGTRSFSCWNGRFVAVVVDPRSGELHIATDRHGTQPLYVVIEPARVLFSTCIAALCADPLWGREIDRHAVVEILSFGCLQGDRTLFERVRAVEAATVLTVGPRGVRRRSYWSLADHLRFPASSSLRDDLEALRDAFNRAVLRRVGADRASILLSGGLDSRCILSTCLAAKLPLHAFTYGPRDGDDVRIARELALSAGLAWRHLPLSIATVYSPSNVRAHVRATGATLSVVHSLGISSVEEIATTDDHLILGNGAELTRGGIYDCPTQSSPGSAGIGELWQTLTRRFNVAFPLEETHGVLRDDVYRTCRDLPGQGVREALRALSELDPRCLLDGYFLQERARRYLNSGGPVFFGSRLACRVPFYDTDYLDLCFQADRRVWGSHSPLARHIVQANCAALSEIRTTFALSLKTGRLRARLERGAARIGRRIRSHLRRRSRPGAPSVSLHAALHQQRSSVQGWLGTSVAVELGLFDRAKVRALLEDHYERGRPLGRQLGAALTVELFLREFVAPELDSREEVLELVASDVEGPGSTAEDAL